LSLVLIGGGAVFALLCLRPALAQGEAGSQPLAPWAERRYFRVALVAAVAGAVASLVSYLAKLSLAAGAALGGAALGGALGSRSGHVWLAQEVAFALSAAVALAALRGGRATSAGRARWLQTAAALLAGVALVLQAFTSHLATGHAARQGPLGPVALAVHLLGAGLWVGGLGYGALVLWPLWRRADQEVRAAIARSAIARFSLVALLSVVAIVVSGGYVAVLMIPRPSDLITSAYGIALDLKIALLLVLVGFGAANRKLLGQIAASAPGRVAAVATTGRRVLSAMRDEFLIAGLVLLAAAIMLEVGPPTLTLPSSAVTLTASATVGAPQPAATPTPAPTPAPFVARLSARDLSIQLTVAPPIAGARNTIRVGVTGPGGAPVTNAQVKLWLTNQSLDMGTQVVTAEPAGPGEYRVAAPVFGAPGTWQVQLVVRRDNVPEAQATATVPVQAPAAASAAPAAPPTAPAAARTIHA
ncbi:MAG: FixH family protein, partial [Thermomicrobiaceae bacterium]|nr:FixH family protein [Thermomicrobiaceae bacterium]